jgi:hypothetical protein
MDPTILQPNHSSGEDEDVLRLADVDPGPVSDLLSRYGLELRIVVAGVEIPGSYWGDEEAGLIGNELLAREDTPLHSILHESCHYICMDQSRRRGVHTDAGGDYDEENAVCYLQVVLADQIEALGSSRMFRDMDNWGYSFRLGSAKAWFEEDAGDARDYLSYLGLLDNNNRPTFKLRDG